jgi:serine/threonine protein phosphatase PrpC
MFSLFNPFQSICMYTTLGPGCFVDPQLHKFSMFAVFDGHGGKEVALFCKEHFLLEFLKTNQFNTANYVGALRETFHTMDNMVDDEAQAPILKKYRAILNPSERPMKFGDEVSPLQAALLAGNPVAPVAPVAPSGNAAGAAESTDADADTAMVMVAASPPASPSPAIANCTAAGDDGPISLDAEVHGALVSDELWKNCNTYPSCQLGELLVYNDI